MENELLQQILIKLDSINFDVQQIKEGQTKLGCGQVNIKRQQETDSALLQAIFDQTIFLPEHRHETHAKFEKLKSVL